MDLSYFVQSSGLGYIFIQQQNHVANVIIPCHIGQWVVFWTHLPRHPRFFPMAPQVYKGEIFTFTYSLANLKAPWVYPSLSHNFTVRNPCLISRAGIQAYAMKSAVPIYNHGK